MGITMNEIYSSIIFRASRRKASILASMSNPINKELIEQISEVCDTPDSEQDSPRPKKASRFTITKSTKSDQAEESNSEDDATGEDSKKLDTADSESDSSTDTDSNSAESGNSDSTDQRSEVDTTRKSDNENSIDSSIHMQSVPVKNLQTILNSTELTSGVRDVYDSSDDLWIYYNDTINLNSVMDNVISSMRTLLPDVMFNRLARTSNAIVFTRG